MADLSVDIVARTNQVKRDLKEVSALADNLGKEFVQAGEAAETMDKSMAKLNTAGRRSSVIWFQAGQAISDFAAAGVLGAANNIEFLAAQIGIGGPLIAAIAVATTSFIVFGDDIKAVFAEVSVDLDQLEKDAKGVADEIIKVRDGLKVTFEGTTDELEADSKRIGQIIEALQKRAAELRFQLGQQQVSQAGGVTTFVSSSPEITRLKGELENVLSVLSRQQGIQESINESVKEQRLLEQIIADLGETTLTTRTEGLKPTRETLTLLQRTQQANERLKEQLEALRNADQSRLGTLLLQNKSLQEQIKIATEAAEARARLAENPNRPGRPAIGVSGLFTGGDVGFTFDQVPDIIGKSGTSIGLLVDQLLSLGPALQINMVKPLSEGTENAEKLSQALQSGLGSAFASLATSLGAGEGILDSLRKSIGTFAIQLGETFIGFGLAGLSLQSFLTNPATAIVAGGALVVLGSALKSSAENQVQSFAETGRVGGSGSAGFVDPRQGRDGRFRRQVPEAGFSPTAPMDVTIGGGFNLKLLGEDLVGSWEKTMQRQERTRGPKRDATRNSTGYRGGR